MIPKKIHYCWFGKGEKSPKIQKCIDSWKKYCSDYELIEWNEENFDVNINPYTAWCYENKKYAFLSDYVRLLVVEANGGIYFDTDVEVVKSFDALLNNNAYFGFETESFVNTGLGFGAEAHNHVVKLMLKEYDILLDGKNGTIGCPKLNTEALLKCGLMLNGENQSLDNCTVFSPEYFNPYDASTGRLKTTQNSYSIHWYSASWMSSKQKIRSLISKPIHRLFGVKLFRGKIHG